MLCSHWYGDLLFGHNSTMSMQCKENLCNAMIMVQWEHHCLPSVLINFNTCEEDLMMLIFPHYSTLGHNLVRGMRYLQACVK
jgi:hypothetical protein